MRYQGEGSGHDNVDGVSLQAVVGSSVKAPVEEGLNRVRFCRQLLDSVIAKSQRLSTLTRSAMARATDLTSLIFIVDHMVLNFITHALITLTRVHRP